MPQETVNAEAVKDKKKFKKNNHFKSRSRACKFKIAAPNGRIYHYNDLKEWITKYGANYPELVEESADTVYAKLIETRDRFIEEKIATDYKGWKLLTTRFDKHDNDISDKKKTANADKKEKKEAQSGDQRKSEDNSEIKKAHNKNKKHKNNGKKSEVKTQNEIKITSEKTRDGFEKKKNKSNTKSNKKQEVKAEDKYSQILKNAEMEIASIEVKASEEEKKQGLGQAIKGFFAGIFGKRED